MMVALHLKSSVCKTVTTLHTTGWGEILPPRATAKGCTTSNSSSSTTSCRNRLPSTCSVAKIKDIGKLVTENREGSGGVKWKSNTLECRHKCESGAAAGRERKGQLHGRKERGWEESEVGHQPLAGVGSGIQPSVG